MLSMNIVIYDTEHFETTYALIRILDRPQNTIAIFTTQKMERVLKEMLADKADMYSWFISTKSSLRFVFRIYNYCKRNNVPYLFLNTVSYHHIYFGILCFILKKTKSILTVHNANNFFNPKLKFRLRSLIQLLGKKVLARTVSNFATLLNSTKQYIDQTFQTKKRILVLPGAIYEGHIDENVLDSVLSLVVCGSIDQYRRDYDQVFELAHELEKKQLTTQIILLGSAVGEVGKKIISKCLAAKFQFVDLTTYTADFVSTAEYQSKIVKCNFIFQPLKKILQKPDEQPEEYGLTCCSGAFFDAVRFAKPLLLPDNIQLSAEVANQCIPYHSISELAEFLNGLTVTKKNTWLHQAEINSLNFTPHLVGQQVFRIDIK